MELTDLRLEVNTIALLPHFCAQCLAGYLQCMLGRYTTTTTYNRRREAHFDRLEVVTVIAAKLAQHLSSGEAQAAEAMKNGLLEA